MFTNNFHLDQIIRFCFFFLCNLTNIITAVTSFVYFVFVFILFYYILFYLFCLIMLFYIDGLLNTIFHSNECHVFTSNKNLKI